MAKASAGGGRDYSSNEPGEANDPQTAEDAPKSPESEIQDKEVQLAQLKAAEKRLQDEIVRLTAHAANAKALDGQLTKAATDAAARAKKELSDFVTTGMKALDAATTTKIDDARKTAKAGIQKKSDAYDQAVKDREATQAAVAKKQGDVSDATKTYAAAKDVTARVKQATADLQALRQKVEALAKANQFVAAGFWLFELQEQLNRPDAPTLDGAGGKLSKAWLDLQAASIAAGTADDELTAANAKEAASKKALDDATKNRVDKILDALGATADPKTAAA